MRRLLYKRIAALYNRLPKSAFQTETAGHKKEFSSGTAVDSLNLSCYKNNLIDF